MVRSEDRTQLTALVSYKHKKTRSTDSEPVTHFVRISPETKLENLDDTQCDPTRNVLRVSFCYVEEDRQVVM